MKIKFYVMFAVMAGAMFLAAPVMAASQTAQSAMVALNFDSAAYQIDGTITWTYHRDDCAVGYYVNTWDGNPPVVTTGTGATQSSSGVPDPDANKLRQHAQAQRCVFFCGGNLGSDTYTQTVNGTRGWKWTYTYNITPTPTQLSVDPQTCWTSEVAGGTVDVGFGGFISSESYLKNGSKTKYSFTLTEPDPNGGTPLSRAQDVSAQLQKSDGLGGWNNVGLPIVYGTLPVTATVADYTYFGNAGIFGNSAVYSALHATGGGQPESLVSGPNPDTTPGILYQDTFANNNNDLANGNVHQANYTGDFPGLTEAGDYRVFMTGTIKGNSSQANLTFNVASNIVVIGGCNCSM